MAQFLTDTQINSVYELYIGYFNRAPEAGGLNYWSNYYLAQVNAGKTDAAIQKEIANKFYDAAVQYNIYTAGAPVADFIKASYLNALGRDSVDDAGMTYWTAKLTSGEVTRGEFVQKLISDAKGFASDATYGWVSKYLDNRMAVAKAFAAANTTTGDAAITAGKAALSAVTPAAVKAGQSPTDALAAAGFAGNTFMLTTGLDNLTGTAGNDVYTADFNGNANTFESGDVVKGGAGNDTLKAFLGNASNFAINATTDSIENVVIRAQSTDVNGSSSNNNIYTEQVTVDADRMAGVNRWEDNNSRATLVVEDVRIAASQVTKDITIAMVDTDPGHVDFGLYFDQQSLRAGASSTASEMSFQLRDGLATADQPLGNLSVDGVKFSLAGTVVTLRSEAIDNAKTYAELVAAINTAIAATPGAAGVSAKVGATFTEVNGVSVTGNYVVLSDAQGRAFTNGGFTHSENNTGRFTELGNFDTVDAIPVNQPVTATIVLDNVGRGSTGGDLVVGGLSVGDTSTSKGVQVFDITVERSSKLQNISSTNKSLEQVILKNGTTKGDVTVLGNVDNLDVTAPSAAVPAKTNTNTNTDVLPGSENHHDAYGLNDIRVLDAYVNITHRPGGGSRMLVGGRS